jgi:hypothetical protein
MVYEKYQLVRVVSVRTIHIKKENKCRCCGLPLEKGDSCHSLGIRDDWNHCWERWYLCDSCLGVINISAGTPQYLQNFALENRLTLETWT